MLGVTEDRAGRFSSALLGGLVPGVVVLPCMLFVCYAAVPGQCSLPEWTATDEKHMYKYKYETLQAATESQGDVARI